MSIPVIDFRKLVEGDEEMRSQMRRGVQEIGFLIIDNTPIDRAQIEELISEYRAFFKQAEALKAPLDMAKTGSNRGWGRAGGEQVNPDANPDYKQVFDVGVELPQGHPLSEVTYYAPNLWPQLPSFKQSVLSYYDAAFRVSIKLLSEMARAADLPPEFFVDKFHPPMALLRANYYPPRPKDAGEKDFGIAAHTDYGCLTLLAADGVSGLEVQAADGTWMALNAHPGQFVINFGEMIEKWSNGKIKATLHRVFGGDAERISVPFFFNPAFDTNVAPLGSGKTFLAGDWLTKRYDETYVHRQKG